MTILGQLSRIGEHRRPPKILNSWTAGTITGLVFESEPYAGVPTEVFAYVARPAAPTSAMPAVVLVHGGGGTAYAEWARMWAQRGYVAIAMDLVGQTPDRVPLRAGWPYRGDGGKFWGIAEGVDQSWMYHAVAAVMHSISLVSIQPGVDQNNIYLTGISWGAHVAELAVSVDSRLAGATFVYGSGFLEDSAILGAPLLEMPVALAQLWVAEFDAKNYAAGITCPTLWISGTADFAYDPISFQRSAELASGPTVLRITPHFPHGHEAGWAPTEICEFFDYVRGLTDPLPAVGATSIADGSLRVPFRAAVPLASAGIHHTTDIGPWSERMWTSADATIDGDTASGALPADATAGLLTVTDVRGLTVSSQVVDLRSGTPPFPPT